MGLQATGQGAGQAQAPAVHPQAGQAQAPGQGAVTSNASAAPEVRAAREADPVARKKNAEAAGLKKRLRELEQKNADFERLEAERRQREAVEAGRFQELYETERQRAERESNRVAELTLETSLLQRLPSGVSKEQRQDILALIPRSRLRLTDEGIEGLDDVLEEMQTQRPYLFAGSGQAAGSSTPSYDPRDPWGVGEGLPAYGGAEAPPAGGVAVTAELIEQAKEQGMDVAMWREIQAHRLKMRRQREEEGRR